MPDQFKYRKGVGLMLLNHENKAFVGQRFDSSVEAWQMPQSLDSLKRQKETVENQSVEAMEQVEIQSAQYDKVRENFEVLHAAWNEKTAALKKDGKQLQQQFQLLKQKRETIRGALDQDSLTLYDELRKRKGGVAVAPLKGDTCGACNMQVPSGVISSARASDASPIYCPSCGRILYGN